MKRFVTIILLWGLLSTGFALEKVIFDTDMNGDVDDVGALAMLHALANLGEAEILACMTSNPGAYVCECVDVVNTYYGRQDIPIGALRGSNSDGYYTKALADAFPHDATRNELPEPVPLYRKILAEQEDSSVTIVSVGFLPNLGQLLRSEPDEFSELNGLDLVAKKVKLWSCMGGVFPSGSEYNLTNQFPDEAKYAIDNWPTRIIFTGWEIGKEILTGFEVHKLLKNSPAALGYKLYYCGWAFDGNPYYAWYNGHYSWDQTAVLIGVRGYEQYWDTVEQGYNAINADGANAWQSSPDKDHAYVTPKMPEQEIAAIIDELMNQPPIGAHFYTSGTVGWLPYQVDFNASISNAGEHDIQSYNWDLGNGESSNEVQVSTTYQQAGIFPVKLSIIDDAGNSFETSDTITVSDPVFSPVSYYGNALNYESKNNELWSTKTDSGDLRYFLRNAPRRQDDPFDGFSFIKDSTFSDFTLTFTVRSGEDWEINRSPDYRIIWGFVDDENYTYTQMSKRTARLMAYANGTRTNLDRSAIPGMPDDDYHRITVIRAGETVSILVDGELFVRSTDPVLATTGAIGFGSRSDAVFFDDIHVSRIATAIQGKTLFNHPEKMTLAQNYPNPFNPSTTMHYFLPKSDKVTLDVYNIAGQKVDNLVDGWQQSGEHIITWHAFGQPAGVYYYTLRSDGLSMTRKMIFLP